MISRQAAPRASASAMSLVAAPSAPTLTYIPPFMPHFVRHRCDVTLWRVSDPQAYKYFPTGTEFGKLLTAPQLAARMAPGAFSSQQSCFQATNHWARCCKQALVCGDSRLQLQEQSLNTVSSNSREAPATFYTF